MPITLEMFPAGNGDTFLIDSGKDLILIDGGYVSTYRDHLRKRLKELNGLGRRLTLFVVTHIDADHITGAIKFLEDNGPSHDPKVIGIDQIWFNTYRHLNFSDRKKGRLPGSKLRLEFKVGLASVNANDPSILVSYPQGTTLGSLILKYGYAWNTSFNNMAVSIDKGPKQVNLTPELKLTLIGPTRTALEKLSQYWYDFLRTKFKEDINEDSFFDDAFELMMEERRQADIENSVQKNTAGLVSRKGSWVEDHLEKWVHEDSSPTNGSSIAFLLEYQGKKMLFLGDAIPTEVEKQIDKIPLGTDTPISLDVLKVAHHGAWSNNSPAMLSKLRADYYLLSSNGNRHDHPHLETLAWILEKHKQVSKTLVFNYRQPHRLGVIDNPNTKKMYKYEVLWPHVDRWEQGLDGYVSLTL